MAKRTRKGNVKASTRKKYGTGKKKKFPVFDKRSAKAALRLRGRGKGISKKTVVDKVARWANAHNDASVKAAVKRARKVDRSG